MKNFLVLFLIVLSTVCLGQSTVQLRGDTILIWKNGGNAELILRNGAKDSTNGVLTNVGNGRTTFLKFRTSQDSLFLGNAFIGLIGSKEKIINFDYPPSYVIVNGDTTDVNGRQWAKDSIEIRKSEDMLFFPNGDTAYIGPVILAYSGASGKTSIWSSGDTLYNKRDIAGSSISITDNADSSRIFSVTESNFILNQFLSKEDKIAWFRKSSVDSSLGGLFIAKSSSSSVGYFTQRDQGTPPTRGTTIGTFASGGYNGTTYNTTTRAGIRFFASETWNGTGNGVEPMFFATKNGTTTTTARMRLYNEGGVGFNAANSELGVMDSIIRAAIYLQASFGTTSSTNAFLLRDSSRNNLFRVDDAGQLFARKYYMGQGNIYPKIDSSSGAITRGNMGDFDEIASAYKYLDAGFISQTLGMDLSKMTTNTAMGDGISFYEATFIPGDDTITGVRFYMHTQGSFTGDNTNSIALYKYDAGTLTKVAETANDENIWKNTATTTVTVAFSTPYVARRGLYFIAALYNSSTQTTAPALGCAVQSVNANTFSVIKPYAIQTGLTNHATTVTHSTLTISRIPVYFSLYK